MRWLLGRTESPDNTDLGTNCDSALQQIPKGIRQLATISWLLTLSSPFLLFCTAIPAIICAVVCLFMLWRNSARPTIKILIAVAMSISIFLACIFMAWKFDALPISDDYTVKDFQSAQPKYSNSYNLLATLADDPNSPNITATGLSKQDTELLSSIIKNPENNASTEPNIHTITKAAQVHEVNIVLLWNKAQKARAVIDKLSSYDEIADLSKTDFTLSKDFLNSFRSLTYLYNDYSILKIQQGGDANAINELIKFDSVIRKLAVNARSLVTKFICYSCLKIDIQTANVIVNDPRTSHTSLEILATHFVPLSKKQTSLRNAILNEYFLFRDKVPLDFPELRNNVPAPPYSVGNYKPYSSYRLYRNICTDWIIRTNSSTKEKPFLKVWPRFSPELPAFDYSSGKISFLYNYYNKSGSALISLLTPPIKKAMEIKMRLEVYGDLFQIALNKRLGKEINLKARAYGDRYIIDKNRMLIYSPGPDCKPSTKDDIKIPFDPNILRF
jgi:hypothetical protein